MPDLMQYPDRAVLAEDLAEIVGEQLSDAIEAKGHASLAVPGGTTPEPFLRALSTQDVGWAKVSVMLTDERFVSEDSERSNTRLLRETLLQGKAAAATLVPMVLAGKQPEDVLDALILGLKPTLPLDVVVLGMGADMHTASLFPGADLLEQALRDDAPLLLPMRADGAGEPRITMTAPVLRAAKAVHLLITGAEKAEALEKAFIKGPEAEAPVRVILNMPQTEIHYAE